MGKSKKMVRRFGIKNKLNILMLIMLVNILISSFACTPRNFRNARRIYTTCNLFIAEIYETGGNHIEEDEYGRVLASSFNMTDSNLSSKKKILILYTIFYLNEKKGTYFQYVPEKYYYLADNDDRESEGFKQFLKDNYWGVKYDDSIKNNYVTNARYIKEYDVGLEERQEIDDKVKSRITDYIIGNDFLAEDDYEFANKIYDRYNKYIYGVFQKSTGNLYGAYVNYEDIEEEIKIVPISYENYREDLNTLKKNVEWYETEAIE